MKSRSGQVALYLLMVLVVITLLVLIDVSTFVTVRAKNRVMNAGDAAALAAATWQGECLNRIGELNREHLELALRTRNSDSEEVIAAARERCRQIEREQREICLLWPIKGISKGSEAARMTGASPNEEMRKLLLEHVSEVRSLYCGSDVLYPPSWVNENGTTAWDDYAAALEAELVGDMYVGPDNVEYVDAVGGHILLSKQFYHAVAGRAWCWFKFNAPELPYQSPENWPPLPTSNDSSDVRARKCMNCEVYSLHLTTRVGSAVAMLGTDLLMQLLPEATAESIADSALLADESQVWFCYDTDGRWGKWSTYPSTEFNSTEFPIYGNVKDEYDVFGAAALCRTSASVVNIDNLTSIGGVRNECEVSQYRTDWRRLEQAAEQDIKELGEGGAALADHTPKEQRIYWVSGAKPFGTVKGLTGGNAEVTALNGLVTPAFSEAYLVPIDAVGARDLSTSDVEWVDHVRKHLPVYCPGEAILLPKNCYYCTQLRTWERIEIRTACQEYLKYHGSDCVRPVGNCGTSGGTAHGH